MEEDFLIIESKKRNISPKKLAIEFLNKKEKCFSFRYSFVGLEKVLYNPKYNKHVIGKMYKEALNVGVTKVSKKYSLDVRKLKMYFLVNGYSIEKIHNRRPQIIAKAQQKELLEPYYQELISGKEFNEVAEKYHFDAKMRKNVVRNLKARGIEINRLTVSQKSKEQAKIFLDNFVNEYGLEIAQQIMDGKNISEIRDNLKKKYKLIKCPVQTVVNNYFKEEYQHLQYLFKREEVRKRKKQKREKARFKSQNKVYGYIYRTTNEVNHKTYIGQHKKDYFDEKYLGSGVLIKQAVRKYGRFNFSLTLLKTCFSKEELNNEEQRIIKLERERGHAEYNISDGGVGTKGVRLVDNPKYGIYHTEERRKRLAELASKRKGENSPLYGRKMTPEHIAKTRRTGSTQSAETRKKISETGKKKTMCPICNKMFPSRLEMSTHYKKVHTPENKKRNAERMAKMQKLIFVCPYCSKEIHSKGNLTQHVRASHKEQMSEYNRIKNDLKPKKTKERRMIINETY